MKKIVLFIVFVVASISINAQSSVLKTNIVDLAYKDISVQYERVINDKSSFQVGISPYIGIPNFSGTAFGASIEYRFYLTKKEALRGFYLMSGLGANFGNLGQGENDQFFVASSINIKANLGYQWIWSNGIIMDLGIGGRYFFGLGEDTAPEFDGMKPSVTIGLGYAF